MNDEIIVKREEYETGRSSEILEPSPKAVPIRTESNGEEETVIPLFPRAVREELRFRWEALQVGFVDEPRQAVEEADHLVSETIEGLTKSFSSQQEKLEQQWHREQDVSTEELRLAFRRYRSFLDRLLSM